jgi:hypothetical protein
MSVILLCSLFLLADCSDTTTFSKRIDPGDYGNGAPVYSLPRAYISLNAISDGEKLTLKWDTQHARFKVVWVENEFYDDHFTIGINTKGLLSALNSTNTDETPKIIVKVIQLAEEANGIASEFYYT